MIERTTRPRLGAAVLALLALLLSACSSGGGTVAGSDVGTPLAATTARAPSATPTVAPSTPAPPSSSTPAASTSHPAPASTTAPRSSAAPRSTHTLCATDTVAAPVAHCLRTALSTFWSGELNQVIDEPVSLSAAAASVPKDCRPGLTAAPAFTCRSNLTLYVNRSLLDLIAKNFPAGELFYALASVQSHEMGHVLQLTLHQPQIEHDPGAQANSTFLEQQADCLSGVWAAHATGTLNKSTFRRVADRLVTLVSSNAEIATHGTPAQRAAALDRGLSSGRPQSCKLTSFS